MHLSDEQKAAGKQNYEETLRVTRRGFLQSLPASVAAAGAGLGAAYFGYEKIAEPLRIGIIGTGDEGNVLIGALNPDFVDVKAICDIRPSSIYRAFNGDWPSSKMQPARPGLVNVYGQKKGWKTEADARKDVKVYERGYDDLLADDEIEAVIIALPLWLHAPAAIDAMLAGKHVLTEKLMAHSVGECKEMGRVADYTGKLLATGHQRHYSVLYANAVDTIKQNVIGDIHHIRAQWHRTADSWRPPIPEQGFEYRDFDLGVRPLKAAVAEAKKSGDRAKLAAAEEELADFLLDHGVISKHKSVNARVKNPNIKGKEHEGWVKCLEQLDKLIEDAGVDAAAYGYQSHTLSGGYQCSPLEELIRWRLWNRTGGGLMAELGSHQLDASGIFISAQFDGHAKVNPLSVTGVGGRHLYDENRDIDDHVYCSFEYPGKGYYKNDDPVKGEVADENKKVVVTYSSINGNGYGGYGEVVMGTDGTLILERESETYLIGGNKATTMSVDADAAADTYETGGGATVAAAVPTEDISRGYREEIEHWAWCIREGKPATTLHCHPKVALADAVIALTSNLAMDREERIEFDPDWFKIESDKVPAGAEPKEATKIDRSEFGKPRGSEEVV